MLRYYLTIILWCRSFLMFLKKCLPSPLNSFSWLTNSIFSSLSYFFALSLTFLMLNHIQLEPLLKPNCKLLNSGSTVCLIHWFSIFVKILPVWLNSEIPQYVPHPLFVAFVFPLQYYHWLLPVIWNYSCHSRFCEYAF